jgi:uncharacterized protein (DUF305 family)
MKHKIILATVVYITAFFLQSCNKSSNHHDKRDADSSMSHSKQDGPMRPDNMQMDNGMMESMRSVLDKMDAMKMTGDFDHDFANMMIMHHQAAIDMSEIEIVKGTDAAIVSMAKSIVTAQKDEIVEMQQFIANHKMKEVKMQNAEMDGDLSKSMKAMMDKMNNMQMTGNTDTDFVRMMIPHHEGAVKMAEDELAYGKHTELKKMAEKMIIDQTKEIDEFNAWLTSNN